MGGDRTCPDDCFIAAWHSLSDDQKTKERRRPIVEQLAKQGYTQEAIALQLGVSVMTISRDIKTFNTVLNVKGQGKDTLGRKRSTGRPKGEGRPKSSEPRGGPKPERRTITRSTEQIAASLVLDDGKTYDQVKDELGLKSVNTVKTAVAREEGRREPQIDRTTLSLSAQAKLDAAIRQEMHRLGLEFEGRVREGVRRRIDEIMLPLWKKQIEEAKTLYAKRKALMDKDTFNTIRRALHPDSRNSISDQKLGEAFDRFMGLEKYLLNEKDSPTTFGDLPDNLAAWDKMRVKRSARSARTSGPSAVTRR
jgi:uncharacterized protein YerC